MGGVVQDFRFALRTLANNPGFAAIAILGLALGIGANTAVFSVVNSVLLRPLEYPEPDRLVAIYAAEHSRGARILTISYPNFINWREQSESFVDMGIYTSWPSSFSGPERPERVRVVGASASLFPVLGMDARIGRVFGPQEDRKGHEHVVVLSDRFWRRRFGGDPNVVGKSIVLDKVPYTVLGVLPPALDKTWSKADGWVPLPFDPDYGRSDRLFEAYGRLKPGVSIAQAQAEMKAIAAGLARAHPGPNTGYTVKLMPMIDVVLGRNAETTLLVLTVAVGLVLLIACANVANLLLAKATGRKKDLVVRATLGAPRWRLARLLFAETAVLALAGGALGSLLAVWGVDILVAAISNTVGRTDQVSVDLRALLFTAVLSLGTGTICGLAPALNISKIDASEVLMDGARSASSGRAGRVRRDLLVVTQVAMALSLLMCAGLMARSFQALRTVDPGFNPQRLLTMSLNLPDDTYDTAEKQTAFVQRAIGRIRATAGVTAAAMTSVLPLVGNSGESRVTFDGYTRVDRPDKGVMVGDVAITPGYFETMGTPLLAGRRFTEYDNADAQGVVMINELAAKRYWPDRDPIGKRLKWGNPHTDGPWLTVVGMVGNVRQIRLDRDIRPIVYYPLAQLGSPSLTVVARTHGVPHETAGAVQVAIWETDPELALYGLGSMQEIVSDNIRGRAAIGVLLVTFAVVALVLAALGLYGVMSYSVSQRTREIGIRIALGARPREVLSHVLAHAVLIISLGVLGGIPMAMLLGHLLGSLVYGVSPTDPGTFTVVVPALIAVGLIAGYLPARRATKVDPMVALRYE